MAKFEELNIEKWICDELEKNGFTEPTEIQEKGIPEIQKGGDVFLGSRTGSGKTLAFGIPVIQNIDMEEKGVQALVICPTRELAIQVNDEVKRIASANEIKCVPIYGGADFNRQLGQIKKGAKIICGTPGRILDHIERRVIRLKHLKMLVLDEADEMLDMGFLGDIEKIIANAPKGVQKVLLSATLPKEIKQFISDRFQNTTFINVGTNQKPTDSVEQYYIVSKQNGKKQDLIMLLNFLTKENKDEQAFVFCNTQKMVDTLTGLLKDNGFNSVGLHGGISQSERKKVLDSFKGQKANILVCTDVASRGIDIKNINYVINFDLPADNELYIHRIGRTGRASETGKAFTLLNKPAQKEQLLKFSKIAKFKIGEFSVAGFDLPMFIDNSIKEDDASFTEKRERKPKNRNDKSFKKFDDRKSKKPFGKDEKRFKRFDDKKSGFGEKGKERNKKSFNENGKTGDNKKGFAENKMPNGKKFYFTSEVVDEFGQTKAESRYKRQKFRKGK